MSNSLPKNQLGETLIGLLIAVAVFAILGGAIFTLTTSSYSLVGYSRSRITARHLAQEKIELIRNLPYEDVGTVGGIPTGPLEQEENVFRNGINYFVKTAIVYVDDDFDEIAPTDLLPTDYKSVRVDVSWEGVSDSGSGPIVLATTVVPPGAETTEGGGTLSIIVFDSNAQPVEQADVQIVAATTPAVNLNLQTNVNGRIVLPGAPACIDCYRITVEKENYSTDRTFSSTEIANPAKPHQSVIEEELTEVSFAIDILSTLNISSHNTRDANFTLLPNTTFNLRGYKILGTDINDDPVYKFDQNFTTDATGNLTITDVEWDNYNVSLPGTTFSIAGTNPLTPLILLPDTIVDLAFALSPAFPNSLLVAFTDGSGNLVASVSATLAKVPTFEETLFSGNEGDPDFGQAFFTDLVANTYDLTATASGFLDVDESIGVSGYTKLQSFLQPE